MHARLLPKPPVAPHYSGSVSRFYLSKNASQLYCYVSKGSGHVNFCSLDGCFLVAAEVVCCFLFMSDSSTEHTVPQQLLRSLCATGAAFATCSRSHSNAVCGTGHHKLLMAHRVNLGVLWVLSRQPHSTDPQFSGAVSPHVQVATCIFSSYIVAKADCLVMHGGSQWLHVHSVELHI